MGLGAIIATDASVVLNAEQVFELQDTDFLAYPTPVIVPILVPSGDTVTLVDTASNIETLTPQEITNAKTIGVTQLTASDASLVFSIDQIKAIESLNGPPIGVPAGDTITIVDMESKIEALSQSDITSAKALGVTKINATNMTSGSMVLDAAQAMALSDPVRIVVPTGDTVIVVDTATKIEQLAPDFGALPQIGITAIYSTGDLQLNSADVLTLVADGIPIIQETGAPPLTVTVEDNAAAIEGISPALLAELASFGVTEIATSGELALSVQQATALEGITIVQGAGAPLQVIIRDTPGQIETLTQDQIDLLPGLSTDFAGILSNDNSPNGLVTLSVDQYAAIEQDAIPLVAQSFAISDTAANIDTLTPNEINGLLNYASLPVPVTVTLGSTLNFSIGQALAIVGPYYNQFNIPTIQFNTQGQILTATIADTVNDFEKLTTSQIDALAHFNETDISATLTADGSVAFSVVQSQEFAADNLSISVPTGDIVSIGDLAASITGFLDLGVTEVTNVLQDLHISGIAATDGSIALSVNEAETLETVNAALGTNVAISAPSGDAVTLSGMAGDIEGMSAAQLGALSSIGVTAVDVTDQSLTLTVAQALALYDPVPITVPPGDTVVVADTEAEIESLTPTEIAGLAAIGVQEIDVSNLTGGGALTIDGGIMLAISGVVPANETITFAGTGGTFALSEDVAGTDVAGTIFGFSPPDTIDLTDVPYETDGNGTAGLATDPNDNEPALQVVENGNTYYLDIDPSQVFLTTPTFELNPDSAGNGTDLTVVEPTVTSESFQVLSGQTSDGIVIGSDGEVEGESGATVNRAVVQSGGKLLGDVGSTINDAFIQGGGFVDLSTAAAGSGTINFGAPLGDPVGGKLEIDDTTKLSATITGFAEGDTIDLTAIQYDPSGSANLVSANVLDVTENGSIYTLDFDPSQNFTGDYFHLSLDSGSGTDITENTTPCYCHGTLIQTQRGQKRVENLKIGDRVMTKAGVARPIKWIGRRSYGGRFIMGQKEILPICIRAGALDENVPRRDLWISPHHAMYLNGVLIEAKDLINGMSIVQTERVERVEYFHIEFDTHDVIFAEGAPSESFIDDDSRALFHNANEYRSLYPDAAAATAQYCAPRLDHGYKVEEARRCIARRAQLLRAADGPHIGPLRGYVDAVRLDRIEGWAQNVDHPEAPVCLDIFAEGKLIGQALANGYRADLEHAGLGSGRHAFTFTPPADMAFAPNAVKVRRSLDGAALLLSADAKRKLPLSAA